MFQDLNWVRITPDRPGRGGTKTGLHTFQQQPVNDTIYVWAFQIYKGAWQRSYTSASASSAFDPASFGCTAIHGYIYPSLTDPAAAPGVTLLGHTLNSPNNKIWDFTANALRFTRGTSTQPAVFLNVNQRCFAGDGSGEGMVMDDRTPAIHQQKNQNLGITAPTQGLSLYAGLSFSPVGSGYCTKSSAYINSPNPNNLISTIVTTDTVAAAPPNGSGPGSASGAVTVAGTSSNTGVFTATGTIAITTGTSLVTLTGWTWPANGEYCGLAINFNGYSFVIAETNQASNSWDIDGNSTGLSATQALIMGVYDGPTYSGSYTITGARVKLTTAAASGGWSNSGTLGYAQLTSTNLIPVTVLAVRSNGLYRNLGNISLGPAGGGTPATITDAQMGAGVKDLGTASSQPWVLADVGKTMVLDLGAGLMLVSTITSWVTAYFVRLADANPGAGISGKRAWWGTGFVGCADAAMDNNVTATLTSATSAFTVADVGKNIMVAGANPASAALYTTITAWISATQVTLAAKNTSGGAISSKQAQWGAGTSGATVGPTYAYAWYDPETGHMSNISPTFQIPKPTVLGAQYADFANLTPQFQVDPGFISYPSGIDATRFSHIMFFRTLSTGGSTLYPIGSLQPFVGKVHTGSASTRGSWNPTLLGGWTGIPNQWVSSTIGTGQIWYDFSSDADLILSGGFRAPQFTNTKPMATIRGGGTQPAYPYLMAYWDRRLWMIPTQEPDKLMYSCDDAQCPLGVPEESYPATNFLRIPSVNSKGVGLRVVGDMMLLTTEHFAYTVAGNNESNYRLLKISSAMPGVGTGQMDEFPTYSGAEGEPVTVFFLGRDWRVYEWTVGGQVSPISQGIQNILDGFRTNSAVYSSQRVHCVATAGRRWVVLQLAGLGVNQCYIWDVDNKTWTGEYVTSSGGILSGGYQIPMTTIYGSTPSVNEVYAAPSSSGNPYVLRSWVRDDTGLAQLGGSIQTFPMNFDGKKTRKQLVSVNLHATAGTYTLLVYPNESTTPASATFGAYPDSIDSIYAPVSNPMDVNAADLVVMPGQFQTDSTPIIGYRFSIQIQPNGTTPGYIWAIDIGYKVVEEPGDGDP